MIRDPSGTGTAVDAHIRGATVGIGEDRIARVECRRAGPEPKVDLASEERICRDVAVLSGEIVHVPVVSLLVAPYDVMGDEEILRFAVHPDSHARTDPLLSPAVLGDDVVDESSTGGLAPRGKAAVAVSGNHIVRSFHEGIARGDHSPAEIVVYGIVPYHSARISEGADSLPVAGDTVAVDRGRSVPGDPDPGAPPFADHIVRDVSIRSPIQGHPVPAVVLDDVIQDEELRVFPSKYPSDSHHHFFRPMGITADLDVLHGDGRELGHHSRIGGHAVEVANAAGDGEITYDRSTAVLEQHSVTCLCHQNGAVDSAPHDIECFCLDEEAPGGFDVTSVLFAVAAQLLRI